MAENYNSSEGACMIRLAYDSQDKTELTGEYILPDYMPDMSQLLAVHTKVRCDGYSLAPEKLDYEGEAAYTIVYADDEGKLRSIVYSENIDGAVADDAISDAGDNTVIIVPAVENCSGKLINQRKINIKCTVICSIRIYEKHCVQTQVIGKNSIEDEISLERLLTAVSTMGVYCDTEQKISGSYDIELDPAQGALKDLILCELRFSVGEVRIISGRGEYSSEGTFSCLYEDTDGEYENVIKKFPVQHTFEVADIPDGSVCLATAYVTSVKAEAETDSYGENRVIELDYTYDLCVECMNNSDTELTADVYSTVYDTDVMYETIGYEQLVKYYCVNFSNNLSIEKKDIGADDTASVISMKITPEITTVVPDTEKKKLCVAGVAHVKAITVKNGESGQDAPSNAASPRRYGSLNFDLPLKYELEGGGVPQDIAFRCCISASDVKYRTDPANIYMDFETSLNLAVKRSLRTDHAAAVTMNHSKTAASIPAGKIILYYPQPGEQVWDIAKRYHTTAHAITAANNLSDGKLSPANVLLIPRGKSSPSYTKVV